MRISDSVEYRDRRSLGRRKATFDPKDIAVADDFCANGRLVQWQRWALVLFTACVLIGGVTATRQTLDLLFAMLVLPFICVILLRVAAFFSFNRRERPKYDSTAARQISLPSYSILVPLYDEAEIIPDLLEALAAIDYPTDKLDIQLVVESADPKTYGAVLEHELPAHIRINVVPTSHPKTKPQALNHALKSAIGELVVVYDAEDIPEPLQLRDAAAVLHSDPQLGCVQACLNVYNREESFLTRQFTIEYTVLFDWLLPTLERLGFPVPLGGTSNHFPRRVLNELGGWDAYNVTEDADLGICLARAGYRVTVLRSTTWEEAPATFSIWLKQRTRWLKGWIQTYLVHMRRPGRLWRELGARGFAGLQVFMGGMLMSAFVHPWVFALAAADLLVGTEFIVAFWPPANVVTWLALFNLVAGYAAGILLALVALRARGWNSLMWATLLMPVYWLLISAAAYRALWQLLWQPYQWEKTAHRARQTIAKRSFG